MTRHQKAAIGLILIVFALSLYNLEHWPRPWFDEGWLFSLARNWVVLGHYGFLRLGEPVPATILNTGIAAVAPVALSFQLIGIGIWQGRWSGIVFLLGVSLLLYHLAQRLYGRKVALWCLAVVLLMPMYLDLHPVWIGRQGFGELPALFFLLAGYALLLAKWGNLSGLLAAPALFGVALQTKPQVLPFFLLSLAVPILWLALWRKWFEARYLTLSLLLSLAFNFAFAEALRLLLNSSLFHPASGGDPYAMTRQRDVFFTYVFVPDLSFRIKFLLVALANFIGLPIVLAMIYQGVREARQWQRSASFDTQVVGRLILWTLSFSWVGWYYFSSIGFIRYLFPGLLIGSIFAAKSFHDITFGFNLRAALESFAESVNKRKISWPVVRLFLCLELLLVASALTIARIVPSLTLPPDPAYVEAIEFLNYETPPSAVVETYNSEFFFLLERDYHYPPDYVQHILNRNRVFGEDVPFNYDLTHLDIDYLVTSEGWPLYHSMLTVGHFELVYQNSRYRVYQNVGKE